MPDPVRLRDFGKELSWGKFREVWLHDEPGIGVREWLSFVEAQSAMNQDICRQGRCRILAHAVRED